MSGAGSDARWWGWGLIAAVVAAVVAALVTFLLNRASTRRAELLTAYSGFFSLVMPMRYAAGAVIEAKSTPQFPFLPASDLHHATHFPQGGRTSAPRRVETRQFGEPDRSG
jgi:hypothetical protein